jgi:NADPH:quinone reductase-like Zn-dependent oxidoreductase
MATAAARTAEGGKTMRAALRTRWGAPEKVVEIREVPRPELSDDCVLVRVRAASVNRSDYYSVTAPGILLRPMVGGFFRPKIQALGGDFAGVVEAVGKDVTRFRPGDEVFGSRTGAFGEYVCARMVAHKPPNVTFEEAAAVPGAALTALQALRDHGKLEPGQSVLVNGASGAVGTFAVQMAKVLGAACVTAVCRTRNVDQARELGADRVVDYTRADYTRGGDRYDLIVDIAGSKSWSANRRVLQPHGTLVIVGAPGGNRLIGPLGHVARTWLSALRSSQKAVFFVAKFNHPDLEVLRELLASGQLKPPIERVYPFAQVAEALRVMGEGHARAKLVVSLG